MMSIPDRGLRASAAVLLVAVAVDLMSAPPTTASQGGQVAERGASRPSR